MSCGCQSAKPCCGETKGPPRLAALVGNPNCGKTTLFNVLCGEKERIGNWSGVTVERACGRFTDAGQTMTVVDLPGTYSLNTTYAAVDECIACDFVLCEKADVIINIVDASSLERHLYLTLQLLELGLPVMVALNMCDVAHDRQIHIDTDKLSHALGCPVVSLAAAHGKGIAELRRACLHYQRSNGIALRYAEPIEAAISQLILKYQAEDETMQAKRAWAIRLLEGDRLVSEQVPAAVLSQVKQAQANILAHLGEEADILIADTKYQYISQLLSTCLQQAADVPETMTARLDRVLLNRILGIPIFLSVMFLLFVFAIGLGSYLQTYFEAAGNAVFVEGVASLLQYVHAPNWLVALLANGVGHGLTTVLTFIPVIGLLFLFLAFLEDSGYMARAAFVVDRMMRGLGLPGKAFVPMIVGFGCNVPAVMAARTLGKRRDRILTIMMTPFMSCGARLAIYAVFTAAFFPHSGPFVVFCLYLLGVMMAIITGFLLRRTLLPGDTEPLLMELPAYHLPHWRLMGVHAWHRLHGFVFRAGTLIVPVCVFIGVLNAISFDGVHSMLATIGQSITPLFAPMGIQADNWPATVGLITGVLAKEVVVGTLNSLYADMSGVLSQQFDGQVGAFAYLLFVLLYFPCVSTMAVMLRELHRGWTIFSACWMTGVAYGVAVAFYQLATWSRHPLTSLLWTLTVVGFFVATVIGIRLIANRHEQPALVPAEEAS